MSNVKAIDFATVQDARKTLKRLIADHPHPLREIDSLNYLDELTRDDTTMSKPGKQRMAEYRERLKAQGIRGLYLFIHDDDRKRLESLAASLDMTIGQCIRYLLDQHQSNQEQQAALEKGTEQHDSHSLLRR
jgi:hypothetical protein